MHGYTDDGRKETKVFLSRRTYLGLTGIFIVGVCSFVLYAIKFNVRVEKVTSGSYLGIQIGSMKEGVFKGLSRTYSSKTLVYMFPIDRYGFGPRIELKHTKDDYENLEELEKWVFYFGKQNLLNSISFKFENDTLSSIEKHSQYFEVP